MKKRNKKKSPAKAVIGASLEIAREHAQILDAAKHTTTAPATPAVGK